MLRKILFESSFLLFFSPMIGCNLSDYIETLPGGYKYAHEGGCLNTLLSYSKRVPGYSYLTDIANNDEYICFANVDSAVCVTAIFGEGKGLCCRGKR